MGLNYGRMAKNAAKKMLSKNPKSREAGKRVAKTLVRVAGKKALPHAKWVGEKVATGATFAGGALLINKATNQKPQTTQVTVRPNINVNLGGEKKPKKPSLLSRLKKKGVKK